MNPTQDPENHDSSSGRVEDGPPSDSVSPVINNNSELSEKRSQPTSTGEPTSELPELSQSSADQDARSSPPYSIHSAWAKRWIVLAASLSAFFSPLTAQIYLPALTVLAEDFSVSNAKINLTVTTYMIFQGITPMFIGGFADSAGRRPAYTICFVIYIAANIGLALSNSYASLLIVRCLQSAGSAATVALCQAVLADIVTSAERGQYIGFTVLPVVLAPSLGPVIGGLLSQFLGWRWIFWFLAIVAAVHLFLVLLFFPETCRRIVGDGSIRPHPIYRTFWSLIKCRNRSTSLTRTASQQTSASAKRPPVFSLRPLLVSIQLLTTHLELFLLLFCSGLIFAGFYGLSTALPSQFHTLYPDLTDVEIGLLYLPLAGGSIASAVFCGPALGYNYKRHARKLGLGNIEKTKQIDLTETKFPIEKARLEVGIPLLVLSTAVMLTWGWAIEYSGGLAVPCVLMFLYGVGMIGFQNTANALTVDIVPGNAGAAVAAGNLTRCLLGAGASAIIVPMIEKMGSGWAYTVFAGLYVAVSPLVWLIMRNGVRWRAEWEKKEAEKMDRRKVEAWQ
ncbi:major facilitator superfamily domain-containing protein [Podospora fimiseda]|uniref:Major facilitator superfamily domain-containing protein n=1 Tax=Podospora fimiseda TaxID=252190 RepID=A0AAN7BIV3_9PEZI|nr:major facilitator superfamily domain-containing protein [Podospora fimiseda]